MQDGLKAVWSIPYVSVASFFFSSLKQNFIAYRSSKVVTYPGPKIYDQDTNTWNRHIYTDKENVHNCS